MLMIASFELLYILILVSFYLEDVATDINFNPHGNLILSNVNNVEQMKKNYELQSYVIFSYALMI